MDITPYFKLMVERRASDLFFSVGAPPNIKVDGAMLPVSQNLVRSQQMAEIAASVMDEEQRKEFAAKMELNLVISIGGVGRFRINLFRQRSEIAMVVHYVKGSVPSMEELQLPDILKKLVMEKKGLILVAGSTYSGKSTTLASMIDYRNENYHGHILTIEDPIDYLHKHKKSIVDQREVGLDTLSYESALKNAVHEAPDVVLIGEIHERSVLRQAIAFAEARRLCLASLHAKNATQAIKRIVNFFPENERQQVLFDLSVNILAIISTQLIPGIERLWVPAVGVLINTPPIAVLIEKGKIDDIDSLIASGNEGMQTLDQSLSNLLKQGKITQENADRYKNCP